MFDQITNTGTLAQPRPQEQFYESLDHGRHGIFGSHLCDRFLAEGHTVGPVYRGSPRDAELLASCYQRSLHLAALNHLRTIAFPSISTGAYRYPVDEAAPIALGAVVEFLNTPTSIELVRFVLFDRLTFQAYERALERRLPPA